MAAITITNAGLNLLRSGLSGADNPLVTYVAVGTSGTTPTVTDTQLGAESFRKRITSYTNGATGEILINGYLGPADDVGDVIAEVGFFGGNTATAAANTGILLAHGLYSHTKLSIESVQIQLDLTL